MKSNNNCADMESNRRAVATCRAELEIAETLAEALKHEIEVRECHLKMAEASIRDDALVYCERKVQTYRPELGTCEDEHWKVVKNWAGLSIVEVQPEADEIRLYEQQVAALTGEIEGLKMVNEELRRENEAWKVKANLLNFFATNQDQQQDEFPMQDTSIEPSSHQGYTTHFLPPDAVIHAQLCHSSPKQPFSFSYSSRYGITPSQALQYHCFNKFIELANLHYVVSLIDEIPTEIFRERTGYTVDCIGFRETFAKFVRMCMMERRKLTTDDELDRDDEARRLYMGLRNDGGRAVERYEALRAWEGEMV
jgi:hypothetical protein